MLPFTITSSSSSKSRRKNDSNNNKKRSKESSTATATALSLLSLSSTLINRVNGDTIYPTENTHSAGIGAPHQLCQSQVYVGQYSACSVCTCSSINLILSPLYISTFFSLLWIFHRHIVSSLLFPSFGSFGDGIGFEILSRKQYFAIRLGCSFHRSRFECYHRFERKRLWFGSLQRTIGPMSDWRRFALSTPDLWIQWWVLMTSWRVMEWKGNEKVSWAEQEEIVWRRSGWEKDRKGTTTLWSKLELDWMPMEGKEVWSVSL